MKLFSHGLLALLLGVPTLRVALLKNVPSLTVRGEEIRVQSVTPPHTGVYVPSPAKITADGGGIKVGEELFGQEAIRMIALEGPLRVNETPYEGALEIRRGRDNQLLVLNEIPVENYLVGLIHGEMAANWPLEAIKAQAVAARTYALYKQSRRRGKKGYDLESDVADQVYAGSRGKEADGIVEKAIRETQGEVLWYLGYFPAYFHSSCGGQTETTDHVWGKREVSSPVIDKFCENSPYRRWQFSMSPREFLDKLAPWGLSGKKIRSVELDPHDNAPRNALVIIETDASKLYLAATELRRLLGYDQLMSTWFDVELTPHRLTFSGTGYGHGVGMCQWGAKGMAMAGKTYREILQHYYPKAVLRKSY